jgi:hypothetical protein
MTIKKAKEKLTELLELKLQNERKIIELGSEAEILRKKLHLKD